jgi:hypothetical protein
VGSCSSYSILIQDGRRCRTTFNTETEFRLREEAGDPAITKAIIIKVNIYDLLWSDEEKASCLTWMILRGKRFGNTSASIWAQENLINLIQVTSSRQRIHFRAQGEKKIVFVWHTIIGRAKPTPQKSH